MEMEIPHKSRQKKGWIYWDFYNGKNVSPSYVRAIEIFVKGKSVALVSELIYRDRWKNVYDFESIEITENDDKIPLISIILSDIKKNLFLTGHFPFFGWEKEMAVKMPPPDIFRIPIVNKNYSGPSEHGISKEYGIELLEYRLKNVDVNNAYYKLTSKVSIRVE